MSSKTPQRRGSNPNDEILQGHGPIPLVMDLSYLEFEFFSDDEDNSCVLIDHIQPSTQQRSVDVGESTQSIDERMSPSITEENRIQIEKGESVEVYDDIPPLPEEDNNNNSSGHFETVSQYLENENNNSHILQSHYDDNSITNEQEKIQRLFHYEVVDREVQTDDLPQTHSSMQTELQQPQECHEDIGKIDSQIPAEKSTTISSSSSSSLLPPVPDQISDLPNLDNMKVSSSLPPYPPAPTSSPVPLSLSEQNQSNPSPVPEDFKISFMNFSIGDIALFVPIDEKKSIWMAFHSSRPYRFLAQESLEHFLSKDRQKAKKDPNHQLRERSRILGRIIYIETFIASEAHNPYQLPLCTCFYICYVEPLLVPKKKAVAIGK